MVAYVAWEIQFGCLMVLDIEYSTTVNRMGGVSILGNTVTSLKTLVQLGSMALAYDLCVGELEVRQSEVNISLRFMTFFS